MCKLLCASCSAQVALGKVLCANWSVQVALRKLLCASCSGQGALRKLVCANWSVQVALRKLLCASCSGQGAVRKLVCASWCAQNALRKLFCASCSAQVAPCKLVPASGSLQVALCTLLRASCSLQVALCKLLCASCSVQVALRKLLCASCSRQGALRKLVRASCSAQPGQRCLSPHGGEGAASLVFPALSKLHNLLQLAMDYIQAKLENIDSSPKLCFHVRMFKKCLSLWTTGNTNKIIIYIYIYIQTVLHVTPAQSSKCPVTPAIFCAFESVAPGASAVHATASVASRCATFFPFDGEHAPACSLGTSCAGSSILSQRKQETACRTWPSRVGRSLVTALDRHVKRIRHQAFLPAGPPKNLTTIDNVMNLHRLRGYGWACLLVKTHGTTFEQRPHVALHCCLTSSSA